MAEILQTLSSQMQSISLLLLLITIILHLFFAGAVARDAGRLAKKQYPMQLVSGITWSFATLIGGVFVAAIYWVFHHSNFIRID